jgi:hypothetical protein
VLAYWRGAFMAHWHLARGYCHVYTSEHSFPWFREWGQILKDRYDIHMTGSGSVVRWTWHEFENGYNAVAREAIEVQWGTRVLEDAYMLAKRQWRASQR